jgi:hypothetical protein
LRVFKIIRVGMESITQIFKEEKKKRAKKKRAKKRKEKKKKEKKNKCKV